MRIMSVTLKELLTRNANEEILLPNFQRDFVWDTEKQASLLRSVLCGFPIGSLLIVKAPGNNFSSRRLASEKEIAEEGNDDRDFLLDGQQRCSTLRAIFHDLFSEGWRANDYYKGVRYRWFLNVLKQDNDVFGYVSLQFGTSRIMSPNELEDRTTAIQIMERSSEKPWGHPDKEDHLGQDGRKRFIKECAERGLVPLFEVFSDPDNGLHRKVLEKISISRANEILSLDNEEVRQLLIDEEFDEGEDRASLGNVVFPRAAKWAADLGTLINKSMECQLSEIKLPSTEIDRATVLFETLNKGGVVLSLFDLVVAKCGMDQDFKAESLLKKVKDGFKKEYITPQHVCFGPQEFSPEKFGAITKKGEIYTFAKSNFLNLISILSYEITDDRALPYDVIKEAKILSRTVSDFKNNYSKAITALSRSLCFINRRCGLTSFSKVPYKLMVLPLAVAFSNDENWSSPKVWNRLEYWWWSSIFSGAYREKQNARTIDDCKIILNWVAGLDDEENVISQRGDLIFKEQKYSTFNALIGEEGDVKASAVEDSLMAYILASRPRDFIDDSIRLKVWDQDKLDIHHIIPLAQDTKIGETSSRLRSEPRHILNSPLNLTPILPRSNSLIRDKRAEEYIRELNTTPLEDHFVPVIDPARYEIFSPAGRRKWLEDRFRKIESHITRRLENLRTEDSLL